MGSVRFAGIRFFVWSEDHLPVHIHARYAETELIVELLDEKTRLVRPRFGSIQPPNAKKSDVRHVLMMARLHYLDLLSLWEESHGRAHRRNRQS